MALQKLGINKKDLKEDSPTGAEAGGKKLAVVLHKGKVFAIYAVCTHEGGPLEEGSMDGDEIICPWHSGAYNIMTGKADENTNWVHDTPVYKIVEGADGALSVDM
ncbi:MAG: Rieske 2Fe-2S domain-containing protein [Candidatus Micrarchaeota archaeon]|nr:Rieske 2Fe-2S domain-containing protein [Candidatus Micrarchaeota archaeon]